MIQQIATSIEQSKALVEMGVDAQTADMYWYDDNINYEKPQLDIYKPTLGGKLSDFIADIKSIFHADVIPAWSLSALLHIAEDIINEGQVILIHQRLNNTYTCYFYYMTSSVAAYTAEGATKIEAVFNLIEKIFEGQNKNCQ